ncbi:MAG: chromate transporter, partial [Sarcina sp.]
MLLKMYLAFLKIGTLAFGGGYAMLPYIRKIIVTDHHWLTTAQFTSYIGVVQISPGAVSVNLASFIGFKLHGFIGGVICILGLATTPFILVTIAYFAFSKFKDSKIWNAAMKGMKPALIALIIYALISVTRTAYSSYWQLIITAVTGVLIFSRKINLIFIILI